MRVPSVQCRAKKRTKVLYYCISFYLTFYVTYYSTVAVELRVKLDLLEQFTEDLSDLDSPKALSFAAMLAGEVRGFHSQE